MARSLLVLGACPPEAHLCDVPLSTLLAETLAAAGASPAAAGASGSGNSDPLVILDARWAAVSARTLRGLLSVEGSPVLLSASGRVVARVHRDGPSEGAGELPRAEGATGILVLPPEEDVPLDGPGDLDRVERARMASRLVALAHAGVRVIRPERIWIGHRVQVAAGAVLWPDIVLRGGTTVASGAEIRPGCWLEDTAVGEGAVVKNHTVASGAHVGPGCAVGPMAHLREGAHLEAEVKVGNFVEVKKTTLHRGAKASHLTYLGDATVGAEANVGAGTITCNYDGFGKHHTEIGAGAFIGSNTALVAPITIGEGAIVGAGAVISEDVPAEALALERSPQKNLEGRAPSIRERNRARAAAAKAAGKAPTRGGADG